MAHDFATFDFETTGLHSSIDRVLEIGIVRTSPSGKVVAEFETLVNPSRDVGPTNIHGITAGMLADAPSFEEIVGTIAEVVNGAVLVAHNANFDKRFLVSELSRANRRSSQIDALCTLQLLFTVYSSGPRKLFDCCHHLGIETRDAHSALNDAKMASDLLHFLRQEYEPNDLVDPVWIDPEPLSRRSSLVRTSAMNPREREATFLASLIDQLPIVENIGVTSAANVAEYLNILDRVLEDRKIERSEAEILATTALDLGLSAERIQVLHGAYVANLCALAMSDHVVTEKEREDLNNVATLLRVGDWESLLSTSMAGSNLLRPISATGLIPGMSVCFTGQMSEPRSVLEFRSLEAGLLVKSGVVKKLDLLVVADSDSSSGKAKKAREYGTRIVTEAVFLQLLKELA